MLNISKAERYFVLILLISGFLSTSLSYYGKLSKAKPRTINISETRTLIDINRAAPSEFERLSGIGPVLAGDIAAYREKHGNFRSIEELKNIKGIGDKKFERIKSLVTTGKSPGAKRGDAFD